MGLCQGAGGDQMTPEPRRGVDDRRTRADLAGIASVLLDLDGCVWFGSRLAPGAAGAIAKLRAAGLGVGFLTNISSGRSSTVAEKLSVLGVPAGASEVLVPIEALADHPMLRGDPLVYVLARTDIVEAVAEVARVTQDPDAADMVVLGRDTELDYQRLAAAAHVLNRGGRLLALNLDARVPVDGGRMVPGNGAIAAALSTASGVQATALGKPSVHFFASALRRFGFDRERTVMVGDTLDSDIAGGLAAGLVTVLVGPGDFSNTTPRPAPDFHIANLAELPELLLAPRKNAA